MKKPGIHTDPGKSMQRKCNCIFFHPDYNCWYRSFTGSIAEATRGLYRQWGLAPRPEDLLFNLRLKYTPLISTVQVLF